MSSATTDMVKPSAEILKKVKPAKLDEVPLVLNKRSLHWITEKICGIVEAKTPSWWWVGGIGVTTHRHKMLLRRIRGQVPVAGTVPLKSMTC